jgi:hypothetical protein
MSTDLGRGILPHLDEPTNSHTFTFDGNKNKPVEAERRLWLAVLAFAIWDIQSATSIQKADDAMKWFLSYDSDVGSCFWVCTHLDLSPSYYRKKAWEQYCLRKTEGKWGPRKRAQSQRPIIMSDEVA